jgi:1-acyl-sn-glycerol-3-phosphate acyltransferase
MNDIVPIRPSIRTWFKHRNVRQANQVLGPLQMKMWSGIPDLVESHRKQNKGILFIINHTSMGDVAGPHYALNCLGMDPHYMAAEFLWDIPGVKRFFENGNFIKVERGTSNAKKAYEQTLEILRSGGVVAMYPEGHIPNRPDSADYWPVQIKNGAARLWIETGCIIVPVGQAGARKVASGSKWKWTAGLVTAGIRANFTGNKRVVFVGPPVGAPTGGPEIDLMALRETDPEQYRYIVDTDTERLQKALTESTQTAIDLRQQKSGKKR